MHLLLNKRAGVDFLGPHVLSQISVFCLRTEVLNRAMHSRHLSTVQSLAVYMNCTHRDKHEKCSSVPSPGQLIAVLIKFIWRIKIKLLTSIILRARLKPLSNASCAGLLLPNNKLRTYYSSTSATRDSYPGQICAISGSVCMHASAHCATQRKKGGEAHRQTCSRWSIPTEKRKEPRMHGCVSVLWHRWQAQRGHVNALHSGER
jgi:hypothetical protein